MSLSIKNIVVACQLTCAPELQQSAPSVSQCFAVEFEPRRFPGLVARARGNNKQVAVFFANGRCIVTGFVDKDDADKMLADILPLLVGADGSVGVFGVATSFVSNMVVAASLNMRVDIRRMKAAQPPASMRLAVWRKKKTCVRLSAPTGCALIFNTGSIVLTGITDEARLRAWYEQVRDFVSQFTFDSMDVREEQLVDGIWQLTLTD